MPATAMKTIETPLGKAQVPMSAIETLTARHLASGKPFAVQAKTHHSARPIVFQRTDVRSTLNPSLGFYRVQPQELKFFNYKVGDQIISGSVVGGNEVKIDADDSDTTMTDARYTPHNADVAIAGLSFCQRNICVQYSESDIQTAIAGSGGGSLDASTLSMLRGQAPFIDPGSLVSPPQVYSPQNLQNAIESLLRPFIKVELQWGGTIKVLVGKASDLSSGVAKSYLETQGEPALQNVFQIPEGYIWNNKGFEGGDTEMELVAKITRPLVVPMQFPAIPLLNANDPAGVPFFALPERVIVWTEFRLHCQTFSVVSSNNG